jgi:hypothetical protein
MIKIEDKKSQNSYLFYYIHTLIKKHRKIIIFH